VQQTLEEIGAGHIPQITALNKIDLLHDPEQARATTSQFPEAVAISALRGIGEADLLALAERELYERLTPLRVRLPYKQGALISLFHEAGQVEQMEHERGGVVMQGRVPGRIAAQFARWEIADGGTARQQDAE
jgi:GTP-binding protein HflX